MKKMALLGIVCGSACFAVGWALSVAIRYALAIFDGWYAFLAMSR